LPLLSVVPIDIVPAVSPLGMNVTLAPAIGLPSSVMVPVAGTNGGKSESRESHPARQQK
jgi:hypothetical protein